MTADSDPRRPIEGSESEIASSKRVAAILREIFDAAESERSRILERACAGDEALRRRVQELIDAEDATNGFLSTPAVEYAAALLGEQDAGSTLPASSNEEGRRLGPYRIARKLGEGGMGIVYEAVQENPQRPVALKLIRGGVLIDDHQVRLFEREMRALARLVHPGIATIHDAGRTEEGHPFFAMELVRGARLDEYLDARHAHPLSKREIRFRLTLFLKICDAIAYAHQRGVIHRDLKPSNIVVVDATAPPAGSGRAAPPDPSIKVLDFGLARITEGDVEATLSLPQAGAVRGTLPYMSPEQARGDTDAIDVRSDVYSLGVLLYRMLAGELPYHVPASPLHEAVRIIAEAPPRRPSAVAPALRGDLETILLAALAKERAARYQSVSALADDVRRFLDNLPILARPPSLAYQLRKIFARHKGPVAFAGALLLAIVLGGIGTTIGMRRAQRAEAEARDEAQTSRAVSDFLTGLFERSDPQLTRGREVTVAEILDSGAAEMEERLKEQPRVRARILTTLSRAYLGVGLYDEARALGEQTLAIRQEVYGEKDSSVVSNLRDLGEIAKEMGDHAAARSYLERAVRLAEATRNPDPQELANSLFLLGGLYASSGDPAAARPRLEQALALREKEYGADSPEVAACLDALTTTLIQLGEFDLAAVHQERAVAIAEERFEADNPLLAMYWNNLGVAYGRGGNLDAAQPAYERAIELWEHVRGEEHPGMAKALNNLGALLAEKGDYERARPLLERGLAIREKIHGPDHFQVATSVSNLASFYRDSGEFEKSRALYLRAQAIFEAGLGKVHPSVALNLEYYALLLRKMGRDAEAEDVESRVRTIREELERKRDAPGP
jgi:eukaryotic-like serine/threonine-protein kinase